MPQTNLLTTERSFVAISASTFEILHAVFIRNKEERGLPTDGFIAEIVLPVAARDRPEIEDRFELVSAIFPSLKPANNGRPGPNSPHLFTAVACVYLRRANMAHARGKVNLGWAYLADARFWAGMADASVGMLEEHKQTVSRVKTQGATDRGKARTQKYQIIKEYAWTLARDMKPKLRGWQSKTHAAEKIRPYLVAFKVEPTSRGGKGLSLKNGEGTIDQIVGYLNEMPDRAEHFSDRRKKGEILNST